MIWCKKTRKGLICREIKQSTNQPTNQLLCFQLRSAWVEISPCLHNFRDAHAIFMVTSPTYMLNVDTPPSRMSPRRFTRPFHQFTPSPLLTEGTRCTSCFSSYCVRIFQQITHANYEEFLLRHLRFVYFRQQVHFLLCHLCNFRVMSKGSSSHYLTVYYIF